MKKPSPCPHDLPLGRIMERIIGIQRDERGNSKLILWECLCKSAISIPWDAAHEPLKARARQVELEQYRMAGMV
ncbi:MAG: hypothetical protein ACYS1A_20365 [Planctomycetota bacterium]|jgi:hypothetical protein